MVKRSLGRVGPILLIAAMAMLVGCSSFNREWNAAPATPASPSDITGRWQGAWRSRADGHTGSLKCVVTEPSADHYRAHFLATYWKIFHFEYTTDLSAKPAVNGVIPLEGSENLGFFAGGVYHYTGHASAADFLCDYKSKYDFGTFTLTRPRFAAYDIDSKSSRSDSQ